jgi:hypothetical protein
MANTPGALQLRLLETIVEVAAEKNSTLVLPFPVELLRYLENASSPAGMGNTPAEPAQSASPAATAQPGAKPTPVQTAQDHPTTLPAVSPTPQLPQTPPELAVRELRVGDRTLADGIAAMRD